MLQPGASPSARPGFEALGQARDVLAIEVRPHGKLEILQTDGQQLVEARDILEDIEPAKCLRPNEVDFPADRLSMRLVFDQRGMGATVIQTIVWLRDRFADERFAGQQLMVSLAALQRPVD